MDLPLLRRRATRLLWWCALPYWLLCQVPWLSVLTSQDWPRDKNAVDLDPWVHLAAFTSTILVYNLPDLASVAIYARMLLHFRRQQQQQQPEVFEMEELPYGGIWVGEPAGELSCGEIIQEGGGSVEDHVEKDEVRV